MIEADGQLSLFGNVARHATPLATGMVFFALLFEPEAAEAIREVSRFVASRWWLKDVPRPADTLHVSILDIGERSELTEAAINTAMQAGNEVRAPAIEIAFDTVTTFGSAEAERQPIVLLAGNPGALDELAGAVIRPFGIPVRRNTHRWHTTLRYDRVAVPTTRLDQPLIVTARRLALVQSRQGQGRYDILDEWRLGA